MLYVCKKYRILLLSTIYSKIYTLIYNDTSILLWLCTPRVIYIFPLFAATLSFGQLVPLAQNFHKVFGHEVRLLR